MENSKFSKAVHSSDHQKNISNVFSSVAYLKSEKWNNLNETMTNSIEEKLHANELKLVIDIHKGSEFDPTINYRPKLLLLRIQETDELDNYLAKWGVNFQNLSVDIMKLSDDETTTLVDWACTYWEHNNSIE